MRQRNRTGRSRDGVGGWVGEKLMLFERLNCNQATVSKMLPIFRFTSSSTDHQRRKFVKGSNQNRERVLGVGGG